MKPLQNNAWIVLTVLGLTLGTRAAFAQSTVIPNETATATATSTPIIINGKPVEPEESRTQSLISEDRPKLQELVEVEEGLADSELEAEHAKFNQKRLNKISQLLQRRKQKLAKLQERLGIQTEITTLEQDITGLETKLATETNANKRTALETKIANKNSKIDNKKFKVDKIVTKISDLETKLAEDHQTIITDAEARSVKLEAKRINVETKLSMVEQKIAALEAKQTSVTKPAKRARIEKQLANKRYRQEKLSARIIRINQKTDKLINFIEAQSASFESSIE